MLYNFNGTLLNVADIVTVSTSKGQRAEYCTRYSYGISCYKKNTYRENHSYNLDFGK